MWRTIDMRNSIHFDDYRPFFFHELCEHAIKRTRGNLVDINVENFGTDVLLEYYIAERYFIISPVLDDLFVRSVSIYTTFYNSSIVFS